MEKPLYVEGSFIPLTPPDENLPVVTRADVGLPEDAFVMGAFGNVYKITPEMFVSWMRLLKKIPNAVLWLIDDNPLTTANLRKHAKIANIELNRLIFSPRTGHDEFCARLKLCDVYLDTYPYNCGSTTNDVMKAGVPLITRSGRTMVSRMGVSILNALEVSNLVADTEHAYTKIIIELSKNIELRRDLNNKILRNLKAYNSNIFKLNHQANH
jgi:predicted O-linked N-acetylglucosamine transferase (SPINDLY family)